RAPTFDCNRSRVRGILRPLNPPRQWSTMKAIIPLAGKGTRLRPHTHHTPKPLLKVGGRPVMSYILDDIRELGIEEVLFIIGYLGDVIRDYVASDYPQLHPHY